MSCPDCGQPFHRSHLLEWLKVKRQCPKCRTALRVFGFPTPFESVDVVG
ncbi:MAG: hypothetical protein ACFFFG_11920 [Candidatus Thorarchaeota archaeon]